MAKSNSNENEGNFKLCVLSMQTKNKEKDEKIEKAKKGMKSTLFTVTNASEYKHLYLGMETDKDYVVIPAFDGNKKVLSGDGRDSVEK